MKEHRRRHSKKLLPMETREKVSSLTRKLVPVVKSLKVGALLWRRVNCVERTGSRLSPPEAPKPATPLAPLPSVAARPETAPRPATPLVAVEESPVEAVLTPPWAPDTAPPVFARRSCVSAIFREKRETATSRLFSSARAMTSLSDRYSLPSWISSSSRGEFPSST